MGAMNDYRIQLDTYSGPMDLLLYLIRRDEVDIYDIPIARILSQYMEYVQLLEVLDPDGVADFLVMAATLMEIKSRMLLPKPPPETEDDDGLDPRADLVRQLLAYRAFREAAEALDRKAALHAQRFGRPPVEVPDEEGHVDLEDVQIWDLLHAFNKLMISVVAVSSKKKIKYDDTPVALHALDIIDRLQRDGPSLPFSKIFEGRTRSEMIGLFLALLELIRQKRVRVEQARDFDEIEVHLLDATPISEPVEEPAEDDQEGSTVELQEAPPAEPVVAPADLASDEDEPDEYKTRLDAIAVADVDLDGQALRELDGADGADAEDG